MWFRQKRELGNLVTEHILLENAQEFFLKECSLDLLRHSLLEMGFITTQVFPMIWYKAVAIFGEKLSGKSEKIQNDG